MDLFSYEKPKYKLPPTVRLFEAFSGIGTQAMALKEITNVEHVGFSEIDKYAIKSYLAIHGDVKNYGDITKMTEIPPCDVFTWSFPCTDLSKAGKQKGLNGTRSGLGFEVMRLLHATKDKPKVLLMENVPDLLSPKFRDGWHEMYNEIESLGYTNYVEVLNAKNYGVAQNRDRVFMVSILGDYSYSFPKPFKLGKRLKDYLEDVVDEKYYLSDKQVEQITNWKAQQDPIENAKTSSDEHIQTITAKSNMSMNSSMLLIKESKVIGNVNPSGKGMNGNVWSGDISPTLTTNKGEGIKIAIKEDTKQGYAIAKDGDGVYINRPHQKSGVVQKEMIQTIKSSGKDIGLVDGTRIRKLTPRETWRLMGISDSNFETAKYLSKEESKLILSKYPNHKGKRKFTHEERIERMSDSQLYKQAGNAIVVNVLVEIFKELL